MEELRPCPFCGGEALYDEYHDDNGMPEIYYREYHRYIVRCKDCDATVDAMINGALAIKKWNRRVEN